MLTAAVDTLAVVIALSLSQVWLFGLSMPQYDPHAFHRSLLYSPVVYLAFNCIFGVYRQPYITGTQSWGRRATKGYVCGSLVLVGIWLKQESHARAAMVIHLSAVVPGAMLAVWLGWQKVRDLLQAEGWALDRTVLVVAEEHGRTAKWVSGLRSFGYDVCAVVTRRRFTTPDGLITEIARHVTATGATCVLVPAAELVANGYASLLTFGETAGVRIKLLSPEVHGILARARVHDESGITIESPAGRATSWRKRTAKRAFDLAFACALLILTSPICLLVAIAVKLESKGPVLFKQLRSLSKHAPPFWFYKFRSMRVGSDELKASLKSINGTSGGLFKVRNDPRLTRVGRIIRKCSIDELPQLLNVIKGEMSVVGPRPLPVKDYDEVTGPGSLGGYYERRATVKAGMTGLWQISGRSELGFREMALLDLYYVDHYGVLFDLEILAHTIPVVLTGRGAY